MSLTTIVEALAAAQADFLRLLRHFSAEGLHRQAAGEPWTPAVILLHMCEAREHYARDIDRLVEGQFRPAVGRSTDDPGRMAAIAAAAAGGVSAGEVAARLEESQATMLAALARLTEADLARPVTIARPGLQPMSLEAFLNRFFVGHHQLHVAQLEALLPTNAASQT